MASVAAKQVKYILPHPKDLKTSPEERSRNSVRREDQWKPGFLLKESETVGVMIKWFGEEY